MGIPAFSTTTKSYMQAHEQTVISRALKPRKIWEQSVDDVYPMFKRTHLKNFLHHIINLHIYFYYGGRKQWRTNVS